MIETAWNDTYVTSAVSPAAFDPMPTSSDRTVLSAIERSVVQLSQWDSLSSLPDGHPWKTRLSRWLGMEATPNALADPRLEALRRFAVAARLRHRVDEFGLDLLVGVGFSVRQVEEVERLVASARQIAASELPYADCVTA